MSADPLAQLAAPPIFVVGVHRSGTTWVFDMLTAHPEVAGVFESGIFSLNLGLAQLFGRAHWHQEESDRERERALFGAPVRLSQLIGREELCRDVRELTARWLSRALEPRTRFLVEKTPQHFRTMRMIDELFPGAAFVHVIRDGRDVVVSLEEAGRSWAAPRLAGKSREDLARQWSEGIAIARREASEGDLRYHEIRYESLRADPSAGLRGLFAFCGVPIDERLVERIRSATSFEALRAGDRDRFRRRGAVGDWRARFSLRDRIRFHRVAGERLVELGYADGPRWWVRGDEPPEVTLGRPG